MPVRVVSLNSPLQPDGLADSEKIREVSFQVGAAESRIAHLHGFAQQALFGGEQQSRAVDVDAAAFEHDAGLKLASHLEALGYSARDAVVVAPIIVLCPAIKQPVRDGDFALLVSNEDRDSSRASSFCL